MKSLMIFLVLSLAQSFASAQLKSIETTRGYITSTPNSLSAYVGVNKFNRVARTIALPGPFTPEELDSMARCVQRREKKVIEMTIWVTMGRNMTEELIEVMEVKCKSAHFLDQWRQIVRGAVPAI